MSWLPYGPKPSEAVPRTLYTGWILYRDIIEPYMPWRVLRQLGYVQVPPMPILTPQKVCRAWNNALYKIEHPLCAAKDAWPSFPVSGCMFVGHFQVSDEDPSASTPEYIRWYEQHSHPYLINAERNDFGAQPRSNTDYVRA